MSSQIFCHAYHNSCVEYNFLKLFKGLLYSTKVYTLAHAIPTIIFKWKQLKLNTKDTIVRLLVKISRSVLFFTGFIQGVRLFACIFHRFLPFDKLFVLLVGCLSSTPVMFEFTNRIIEYNLFTIPRVIEGFWDLFNKLNYISEFGAYRNVVFGVFMAIGLVLNKYYIEYLPEKYKTAFNLLFGKQEREVEVNNTKKEEE